jgi:hypothetical protein
MDIIDKKIELSSKIKNIKHDFGIAVQKAREGKLNEVIQDLIHIHQSFPSFVQELSKNYENLFFEIKFPNFKNLKDSLESIRKEENPNNDQVLNLLVEIEKHITIAELELKSAYQKPFLYKNQVIALVIGVFFLLFIFNLKPFSTSSRGLTGFFYKNYRLSGSYRKLINSKIDFNWKLGKPLRKWGKDHFSARWVGFIKVPKTGNYDFMTDADDGVKVWLGKANIINKWNRGSYISKGTINLKKGYYPIRIDYFEHTGPAKLILSWKFQDWEKFKVISPKFLVPSEKELPRKADVHSD